MFEGTSDEDLAKILVEAQREQKKRNQPWFDDEELQAVRRDLSDAMALDRAEQALKDDEVAHVNRPRHLRSLPSDATSDEGTALIVGLQDALHLLAEHVKTRDKQIAEAEQEWEDEREVKVTKGPLVEMFDALVLIREQHRNINTILNHWIGYLAANVDGVELPDDDDDEGSAGVFARV